MTAHPDDLRERLAAATRGEYEIHQELGRGGMAAVFLAVDLTLGRRVAIKMMIPGLNATAGMADRFLLEARTAAQLSHSSIIPIHAVRTTADLRFFVMKYVTGRSLERVLAQDGRLAPDLVRALMGQIGAALEHAHQRGVVHRDVKPANIILDEDGSAIVADFGIAKVAQSGNLTRPGSTIGTPAYMSPEQCTGQPVTGASDQYALGCVAFELLTGRPPFVHEDAVPVLLAHVSDPPPPLIPLCPECPFPLAGAVDRMLAKRPEDRWPTLAEALEAIDAATAQGDPGVRNRLQQLAGQGAAPVPIAVSIPEAQAPWRPRVSESASMREPEVGPDRSATLDIRPGGGILSAGQVVVLEAGWLGDEAPAQGVRWESDDPSVLRISDEGELTAVRPGSTRIRAMLGNGRSEVVYQVTRVDVSSVRILPRVSALGVGEVFQLEAQATDRLGSALAGRVVTWLSTDPQVVVVSQDGRIRGTGAGRARVSASIGAGLASMDLTVSPPVVTGVRIEPSALTLRVGETGQVRASVQGSRGTTLPGVAVEWASSDPQIAAVSAEGLVTALRFGTARIAATAGGRRATLGVEVRSSSVTTISAPRVRIGGEKA